MNIEEGKFYKTRDGKKVGRCRRIGATTDAGLSYAALSKSGCTGGATERLARAT
jgi:hypothetical protein